MGNTSSQSKTAIPPPILRQDRDTAMLCWSFLKAREMDCLIEAHRIYYLDYPNLYHKPSGHQELQNLWKEVWEKQRLLPTYGLQEYCDDKPFHPTPSFTEPPKRSCYLHYNSKHHPLDLDNVNVGFWQ